MNPSNNECFFWTSGIHLSPTGSSPCAKWHETPAITFDQFDDPLDFQNLIDVDILNLKSENARKLKYFKPLPCENCFQRIGHLSTYNLEDVSVLSLTNFDLSRLINSSYFRNKDIYILLYVSDLNLTKANFEIFQENLDAANIRTIWISLTNVILYPDDIGILRELFRNFRVYFLLPINLFSKTNPKDFIYAFDFLRDNMRDHLELLLKSEHVFVSDYVIDFDQTIAQSNFECLKSLGLLEGWQRSRFLLDYLLFFSNELSQQRYNEIIGDFESPFLSEKKRLLTLGLMRANQRFGDNASVPVYDIATLLNRGSFEA